MASSYLGTSASKPGGRNCGLLLSSYLTTYINAATARFVEFFDAANEQRGHADKIVLQKIGNFGLFFLKLLRKY